MGCTKLLLIVQAIFFAQVSSRAINISTTWTLPQEAFPHFFRFIHESVTWETAKSVCESYQAELLTVETTERRDAVRAYLRELDVLDRVWIGLSRPSADSPFVWTGGGPVVGDGAWQEPPALQPSMQCAAINPLVDFRWLPLSCTTPEVNPFICQLPVPVWAKGCLVSSLPSLTVTYLLERQVIELLSDCGLSGTRRIACRGEETPTDLIKRLSCERNKDAQNVTMPGSSSTKIHSWETSTPLDGMTRSSGTRHKRESRGTTVATDSSILSSSSDSPQQNSKYDTEIDYKEREPKSAAETTTVTVEMINEDQIEENSGVSIDQMNKIQISLIESEGNQSETAVTTSDADSPTVTTDITDLHSASVSTEAKLPEAVPEHINEFQLKQKEGLTAVSGLEDLISTTEPVSQTSETVTEAGNIPQAPTVYSEAFSQSHSSTTKFADQEIFSTVLPYQGPVLTYKNVEGVLPEKVLDVLTTQYFSTISNFPLKDATQLSLITGISLQTQENVNDVPTAPADVDDPGNKGDVIILDNNEPQNRNPEISFTVSTTESRYDPEDFAIDAKKNKLPGNENHYDPLPSTEAVEIVLVPDLKKTGKSSEKYQTQTFSMNKLYNNKDKGRLNFIASPVNHIGHDTNIIKHFQTVQQEETSNGASETLEPQTDIPVIVIAEMDEIGGKEQEEVEQVQPFTFVQPESIEISSEQPPATTFDEASEKYEAEQSTNVNLKVTEAVPKTGRPLGINSKNDSVNDKILESTEKPQEQPAEISRITANEPKDTVSDSTTRVQTFSTPTQVELQAADESNDDMETHKRLNRGRIYSHTGPLSFYPYFLNRVLG